MLERLKEEVLVANLEFAKRRPCYPPTGPASGRDLQGAEVTCGGHQAKALESPMKK